MSARILILTVLAMIAFASNSLLCRAALKQTAIDPATFTFVRIFSGAVMLWLILQSQRKLIVDIRVSQRPVVGRLCETADADSASDTDALQSAIHRNGNWPSAIALFAYAAGFSFAYVHLSAGTGTLLLFGAVQATMILWGLRTGERLDVLQIVGLIVALTGLVVLVSPGISAPPLIGSVFMLGAGIAWGVYSLRGRTVTDATAATTGNFLRAIPFAVAVSLVLVARMRFDSLGIIDAVISGAITSGVGYVIWYAALPGLKATSAATVQLSVPVLAAAGGILLLHEPITLRYFIASVAVLGGIFLVVIEKRRAV